MNKVKSFLSSKSTKVGAIATMAMLSVPALVAHADTVADSAAATSALSTGFADTKTIFLAVIGGAVGAAIGLFAIKYAINQGVKFFDKLSNKG